MKIFNAIMDLNKRKKPNQSSLSSSEAECSDNEQGNYPLPQTVQTFPHFIIIESTDENTSITSLSPFVIQKVFKVLLENQKV